MAPSRNFWKIDYPLICLAVAAVLLGGNYLGWLDQIPSSDSFVGFQGEWICGNEKLAIDSQNQVRRDTPGFDVRLVGKIVPQRADWAKFETYNRDGFFSIALDFHGYGENLNIDSQATGDTSWKRNCRKPRVLENVVMKVASSVRNL